MAGGTRSGDYLAIRGGGGIYTCLLLRSRTWNEQHADAVLDEMLADYNKYIKDGARTTPRPEIMGRSWITISFSATVRAQATDEAT